MSAVVRRATRLSGTFAVLTGGSNDDLQRKVYWSCLRVRENAFAVLTGFGGGGRCVLPKTGRTNTVYLFSYITFLDLY
jgi:hypothetical protein